MIGEAEYDLTQMAFQAENRSYDEQADKKLYVRFQQHPHLNDVKSREEGRPVFEMADYIQIMVPGDKDNVVFRPVRPEDTERFSRQYFAFKNNQTQASGTPLIEWNQVTRAQVEELKFFNVHTVEQLAAITDVNAQKFMGINVLREKARKFLELQAETAPLDKLNAELVKRDEIIAAQAAQLASLSERLEALEEDED